MCPMSLNPINVELGNVYNTLQKLQLAMFNLECITNLSADMGMC